MKLGSLFDGSGGFPLAGVMNNIEPVWASEIEPYPLKVTAARFPNMKQLGDITKINGADIEPVDIITFGSPCQDLSIAGKQAGIHDGERSNLFFQAIRIIKEMRNKTNGQYPRFALWENVPGAFSSNKGEDFRAVLEAFAGVRGNDLHVPRPEKNKWLKRGGMVGNGWSLAWRVYDAQYWGVPQRRKRIYLVADFASERAPEILFECESVSGDFEESRETREGTAAVAEGGIGRSRAFSVDCYNQSLTGEKSIPIRAAASDADHVGCVCYANQEIAAFMGGQGAKAGGIGYCEDGTTPTLKASPSGGNTVPDVCYPIDQYQQDSRFKLLNKDDPIPTPPAQMGTGGNNTPMCLHVGNGQLHSMTMSEQTNALDCMHDQQAIITNSPPPRKYIIRRLTPLECCRLQGFPDWWEEGVEGSDTARYKMWGNGIALPCAVDVLSRFAKELTKGDISYENDRA